MKIPSIKVKKCRISSQCREEISTDGYVQTSLHGQRTRSYPSIGKETLKNLNQRSRQWVATTVATPWWNRDFFFLKKNVTHWRTDLSPNKRHELKKCVAKKKGLCRGSNPRPRTSTSWKCGFLNQPEARIIPLDHRADWANHINVRTSPTLCMHC